MDFGFGQRAQKNFRALDMVTIDDLFEMGSGYVLNFSDRTFANFFAEQDIDIDDPSYSAEGTSKAKRLRYFLQTSDKATVVRVLNSLWEYREVMRNRAGQTETIQNAHGRFLGLLERLQGPLQTQQNQTVKPAHDRQKYSTLQTELMALGNLGPQERGYAFEKFLKKAFDMFSLQARDAFRLEGEQIDGSFVLGNETYLLEAKWQNTQTGVAELRAFNGKLEEKAAWTRGLFVGYLGFSDVGLSAFGKGKRVICMDGHDMSDALSRELPLNAVLERKVRHAAETGIAFRRVRDLFPI
jgi:hypothetical protein